MFVRVFCFSVFTFFYLITSPVLGQPEKVKKLPYLNYDQNYLYSVPLNIGGNEWLIFYYEREKNRIRLIGSFDDGINWEPPLELKNLPYLSPNNPVYIDAVYSKEGKIFFYAKDYYDRYFISTDKGYSWSEPARIPTGQNFTYLATSRHGKLTEGDNGEIYFSYFLSDNRIYFTKFNPADSTWTQRQQIVSLPIQEAVQSMVYLGNNTLISVYGSDFGSFNNGNIFLLKSTDGGSSWSSPNSILSSSYYKSKPGLTKTEDGTLWLFFISYRDTLNKKYMFANHNPDIYYAKSLDNGSTWSEPTRFTYYKGPEQNFNIAAKGNSIGVSYSALRESKPLKSELGIHFKKNQLFWGIIPYSSDADAPPYIDKVYFDTTSIVKSNPTIINASVYSENPVSNLIMRNYFDYKSVKNIQLFDDGQHHDYEAGDNIFGAVVGGLVNPISAYAAFLDIELVAKDVKGNEALLPYARMTLKPDNLNIYADGKFNRLQIPLDNKGNLGAIPLPGTSPGGKYDDLVVLFAGGFLLTGTINNDVWLNGVMMASLIGDYLPGSLGRNALNTGLIFIVRSDDPPFGNSWQGWRMAVKDGAPFYDGDGDGVYNPVDKNGNGLWDIDEDRPDLIGDYTAWCVFNDGVPREKRRLTDTEPVKIEVQQTIFGWKGNPDEPLGNTVFVRYKIENKNYDIPVMDSVYFGIIYDPDIGEYTNDLIGCDTILNSGFTYNSGPDNQFGANPPTLLIKYLQGAPAFIPGVSFIDNNFNSVFDPGIDTPIDTAIIKGGSYIGLKSVPGAVNLNMTSHIQSVQLHPGQIDNKYTIAARLKGRIGTGQLVDPCSWLLGSVFGVNCSDINPLYMYSGDPITQFGWINNVPIDQRTYVNSGPFSLEVNKPVEIIVAYLCGRGTSHLNSITVAKEYAGFIDEFYANNFTFSASQTTSVKNETTNRLGNNYPNPFNPVTTIAFNIKEAGRVKLKVFDILGKEVVTLVDENKNGGTHTVVFDGSRLPSGVYFYELKINEYREIKKMILMR